MLRQCRDHLDTVQETYLQHAAFASLFAVRMIGAGLAILIHALIPCLFVHTGSDMVKALYRELNMRGQNPNAE